VVNRSPTSTPCPSGVGIPRGNGRASRVQKVQRITTRWLLRRDLEAKRRQAIAANSLRTRLYKLLVLREFMRLTWVNHCTTCHGIAPFFGGSRAYVTSLESIYLFRSYLESIRHEFTMNSKENLANMY